jgi:hypothetical protein
MNSSVLNNWGSLLSSAINEISEKVFDYTDVLVHSAQIICGIFAFAYIGFKLWKQWSNGEVINFYSYLRPFVIALVISFLPVLSSLFDVIIKPIEAVSLSINSEIVTEFQEKETEYYSNYEKLRDKVAVYEREEVESGSEEIISDSTLMSAPSDEETKVNLFRFIIEFLDNLMQYIQMALIYFFPLYVSIAKMILLIIGPFMLALSIMPSFTGNLSLWITYYIRIMIIPSIFYLLGSFMAIVNIHCYYVPLIDMIQGVINIEDEFLLVDASKDFLYNKNIIGIVISLITICVYIQIPRFANWIIRPDRYMK